MPEEQKTQDNQDDVNALEKAPDTSSDAVKKEEEPKKSKLGQKKSINKKIQKIISYFNIYLLAFIFLVIIIAVITIASYLRSKDAQPGQTPSQELTDEAFSQLQNSDAVVGDPKQTLTVESNSIFSGQVLVRDNLEVAGSVKIGEPLNLNGLTVSGNSVLDQIQGNSLTINGDSTIQGQLSVGQGLSITGGASFGAPISAPSINVQNFQISGDIQLGRHIDAGGPSPSKTNGNALGSGGTASLSGTDTAGTIAINTGSGTSSGCFVTVFFNQPFGGTPHVVITPVGSGGAGINYYTTRTSTQFSICTTSPAPGNTNFAFDYIVID